LKNSKMRVRGRKRSLTAEFRIERKGKHGSVAGLRLRRCRWGFRGKAHDPTKDQPNIVGENLVFNNGGGLLVGGPLAGRGKKVKTRDKLQKTASHLGWGAWVLTRWHSQRLDHCLLEEKNEKKVRALHMTTNPFMGNEKLPI